MVASKNISQRNYNNVTPGPVFNTAQAPTNPQALGANNLSNIIAGPQEAEYTRQMLTWRTPHLGYVQMYINPQNMTIQEAKDITSSRTKAGFVVQYAGEKLTKISISGTTGTAGMEGINILEQVYLAEQFAFEPIAEALERSVSSAELLALFKGTFSVRAAGIGSANAEQGAFIDNFLSQSTADAVLDILQQPFPTLASLAASIEMFFQGVNYKGYFESFRVEENGQYPGHFNYSMEFTAYAKQGTRRNFMPWHKQPSAPADWNGPNNMSFYQSSAAAQSTGGILPQTNQALPDASARAALADTLQPIAKRRDINTALGVGGKSINNIDLRDTEA
jgi:hypothetical protein